MCRYSGVHNTQEQRFCIRPIFRRRLEEFPVHPNGPRAPRRLQQHRVLARAPQLLGDHKSGHHLLEVGGARVGVQRHEPRLHREVRLHLQGCGSFVRILLQVQLERASRRRRR